MKAYITILGRSTWALLNTYYAVLVEKAYFPDTVYIFAEDIYAGEVEKASEGIKVMSEEYGFSPEIETHIVKEAEFVEAGMKISSLVRELKEKGYRVAIDITPGRKALVAAALIPAIKFRIDHVFYLAVKSLDKADKPYMMIPLSIQNLRDFIEEVHLREGSYNKR